MSTMWRQEWFWEMTRAQVASCTQTIASEYFSKHCEYTNGKILVQKLLSSSDPHPDTLFWSKQFLTYHLWKYILDKYILTFYFFRHKLWHSFWHILWRCFWHSIWLRSGIYSGILSGFRYDILSDMGTAGPQPRTPDLSGHGVRQCSLKSGLAVEVRQCPLRSPCTLRSGACGWGPAVPTEIWSSWFRRLGRKSGGASWRRGRRAATLIKSRTNHAVAVVWSIATSSHPPDGKSSNFLQETHVLMYVWPTDYNNLGNTDFLVGQLDKLITILGLPMPKAVWIDLNTPHHPRCPGCGTKRRFRALQPSTVQHVSQTRWQSCQATESEVEVMLTSNFAVFAGSGLNM